MVVDEAKPKILCKAENHPFKINKQTLGRSLSGYSARYVNKKTCVQIPGTHIKIRNDIKLR